MLRTDQYDSDSRCARTIGQPTENDVQVPPPALPDSTQKARALWVFLFAGGAGTRADEQTGPGC